MRQNHFTTRVVQKALPLLCIVCAILLFIPLLRAEVEIVINKGIDAPRPIAIVPFKWHGPDDSKPCNISAIISSDLRHSGKFNPLLSKQFPQLPISISNMETSQWKKLGIDSVVIGQLQLGDDGHYLISYQLINTSEVNSSKASVIEENQCRVAAPYLRYAAHTISNHIFEKLTGIKGAFTTRIAYVVHNSNGKYPYELQLADYDGHQQKTIFRSFAPIMSLAWSPDNKKLAYVSFENQKSELFLHNLSSKERIKLASFPRHNGAPAFSYDGTKLAMALSKDGNLKIYLLNLISGGMEKLTDGCSNDTEPSWHPDGQSLIFTSDRGGHPEIYQMHITSKKIQRITWEGIQNQCGKISPDGKFLVMVYRDQEGYHIAKQKLDTGVVELLSNTSSDETPSIAPNSTMVIYSSTGPQGKVLQLVSMDGRFKARLLAIDGQAKFPAWSYY